MLECTQRNYKKDRRRKQNGIQHSNRWSCRSRKSTIAKRVAKELGFIYVDTGAMYRAMAIYFVDNGIDGRDEAAVSKACADVDVRITYEDGAQQVILNGENVTGRLRQEEVGAMASAVAVYAAVRSKLVELQRQLAEGTDVIMDGRDIGTCVLPAATAKVYLTASVEARAQRRYDELLQKGEKQDIEVIKADIEKEITMICTGIFLHLSRLRMRCFSTPRI